MEKIKIKIVAIVQARMGSTRLPGKVLMPILNRPMLEYIVERLKTVKQISEVLVATSENLGDIQIADFCKQSEILFYQGSENDVLDRFYQTAKSRNATHVIRVTADCPLIDPTIIMKLIDLYFIEKYDHCGVATGAGVANQGFVGRYPDGLDAEIFSFECLEKAWKEAIQMNHREHVTPFIWQQTERFKVGSMKSDVDYSSLRLTVDNSEDFALIRWIYEELYPKNKKFNLKDVIDLLQKNREKLQLNNHLIGKEGYEMFWK